ncbi:MAG: hydroxymethylpyrimidine/phosphomethylpyrimidine kinase [Gammaproteobacteria bacterium]|nr:hydroxymethylpyrimidine/phosphomethylpyrimidine kinase [Gammaproteobacteria bacterium]
MNDPCAIPVVMTFSGCDSTGGAGVQADIESIASMGCHAAPVITAVTIQNTHSVSAFQSIDAQFLFDQAQAVFDDMPVGAIKIGMVGSVEVAEAICSLLASHRSIPVVYDPVLAAGGGGALSSDELVQTIVEKLCPLTTILTPNSHEARILVPNSHSLDECGKQLIRYGCQHVLITGTHEPTAHVSNTLFDKNGVVETFYWDRLNNSYHGSGCTLASALAGLLARGLDCFTAAHEAQEYTLSTLQYGYRIGDGQHLPNRLYWARHDQT